MITDERSDKRPIPCGGVPAQGITPKLGTQRVGYVSPTGVGLGNPDRMVRVTQGRPLAGKLAAVSVQLAALRAPPLFGSRAGRFADLQ